MSLSVEELRQRHRFDWVVLNRMRCPSFDFAAYRSSADCAAGRNPITSEVDAAAATWYLLRCRVPTLVGPNEFSSETVIGASVAVTDYPYAEPSTWVVGRVPYSPHFRAGAPVCLGDMWTARRGHVLLGELVIHLCRLLNWDEVQRGGGYVGWNPAAIDYVNRVHGGGPLRPGVRYPALPLDLVHGTSTGRTGRDVFSPVGASGGTSGGLDHARFIAGSRAARAATQTGSRRR